MKKNKLKKKALVLLAAIAVMLLLPQHLSAQDGGLFGLGTSSEATENAGVMGRGSSGNGGYNITTQQFGSDENGGYNITTQQFGQETPIGSGFAILVMAGAGYAALKRKQKNQKSNK
ncbi:MAG: hypothetical protein IKM74_06575 [Bacteroidales bacterium]|nr:hypothetical protein [Bacteroidales bacterium]